MLRTILSIAVLAAIAGSISARSPETSRSLSFAVYKEARGPVTVLVGTFPAALDAEESYIPLQIAVGVRGKNASLTVTPESFTLLDADGKRYPMAGFEELWFEDRLLRFTPAVNAAAPLVTGQQFANSVRLASSFFPVPGSGSRIERVHLERSSYFKDLIFFPRPDLGLDGVMTLRVQADGMTEPIEVRFEIPLKGSRRAARRH